jgi:hypothetical protein
MKRSAPKTRWSLIVILVVASAFTYLGFKYFVSQSPEPLSIDLINSISYGNIETDGYIQKDAPLGKKGNYLLVSDNTSVMLIDQQGLDGLVGKKVHAKGVMSEPNNNSQGQNVFTPTSIEVIK